MFRRLGGERASLRTDRRLDHGTWCILHHLRPAASTPVVQISIDERMPPESHLGIDWALAPLRDEGVLAIGYGEYFGGRASALGLTKQGR